MTGDTLKKLRRKCRKTVQEVADAAGIDRSYLSNIENNRASSPAFDVVQGICRALGVTIDEMVEETEKDNVTLDIFDKVFNTGYDEISLYMKEKLLKDLYENKYRNELLNVYGEHISKL